MTRKVVGTWPHQRPNPGLGYLYVTMRESVLGMACSGHPACSPMGEALYCDDRNVCDDCINCLKFRDGFDMACPAVCGGPTNTVNRGEHLPNLVEDIASGPFRSYVRDSCGQYADLHVQAQSIDNLYFAASNATHQPNRMAQRLFQNLVQLAALAAEEWAGAEADLIVLDAYQSPPQNEVGERVGGGRWSVVVGPRWESVSSWHRCNLAGCTGVALIVPPLTRCLLPSSPVPFATQSGPAYPSP